MFGNIKSAGKSSEIASVNRGPGKSIARAFHHFARDSICLPDRARFIKRPCGYLFNVKGELVVEKERGPWKIKESHRKYRNEFIDVIEDQVVRPDGKPGSYATVKMKPGVCILPADDEGFIYLTSQFRYAIGEQSLEAASGGVDEDESPLEAAKREAREELGIEAEEWFDLGFAYLDTSIIHCPVSLFLAKNLTFTKKDQEGTESIEILRLSLNEAVKKVMNSEINHGPSCVLILKAESRLKAQPTTTP